MRRLRECVAIALALATAMAAQAREEAMDRFLARHALVNTRLQCQMDRLRNGNPAARAQAARACRVARHDDVSIQTGSSGPLFVQRGAARRLRSALSWRAARCAPAVGGLGGRAGSDADSARVMITHVLLLSCRAPLAA